MHDYISLPIPGVFVYWQILQDNWRTIGHVAQYNRMKAFPQAKLRKQSYYDFNCHLILLNDVTHLEVGLGVFGRAAPAQTHPNSSRSA